MNHTTENSSLFTQYLNLEVCQSTSGWPQGSGQGIPQASDGPTEDTVASQSSQLKGNETTVMGQFATITLA